MMMIRSIAALLLAAPLAVQAQASDPLSSHECAAARAELESALNDDASTPAARAQRLAMARRQAALACLGPSSGQPHRSGAPEVPRAVPPPVISSPRPEAVPAPAATPLPPLAIPRPATITTCDPTGCWDSEGRRLNQVGPLLMGPRGLCNTHGGAVTCL